MRSLACLGVVVASLALPAAATAKGLATVNICGPEECVQLEEPELASRVASPQETVDPPTPAAYYRVRISFEGGDGYSTLFVPTEELIATNAGGLAWYVPRTDALRSLRAAVKGLSAHAPPPAWPRYIEATGPQATPRSTGRFGSSWLLVAVVLVVGGAAFVAARRRIWRPTTA